MWYCNSIENGNILVYKYNTDTSIKAEKWNVVLQLDKIL